MEKIIEFIKSDIGLAITWVCGVVSALFTLVKVKESKVNQANTTNNSQASINKDINQVNLGPTVNYKDSSTHNGDNRF